MRLMIVGSLNGHISQAGKIALQRGAKVLHCEDIDQAMGALRNGKGADIAMIDVKQDIGKFISQMDKERIHIPVVACGINNDTKAAVNAIQQGAKEYIPLPPDADLIAAVIEAVTEESNDMIANDPSMKRVIEFVKKIAPSEATVLITGESGTGKEVMSNFIHKKSKRAGSNFIAINCAAIPENLLESELFGHEKGSFTGATSRRIGKFEEANGGTLLLDEITEMHPLLQAKLLRAIQERIINRLGSNDNIKIDVRIIATSNRNLIESVKKGEFREDLYFRLNVMNVHLPPLRERPSDVIILAQFFIDKYAEINGLKTKKISNGSKKKIQAGSWRGNIRELENAMHRAILISMEDEIEPDAIQAENNFADVTSISPLNSPSVSGISSSEIKNDSNIADLKNQGAVETMVGMTVADVEKDLIINTLNHCIGNRTHAAKILGISIRTLRNKLNLYRDNGMDIPMGN